MKAMILAAGFGSRLLPYTRYKPKPLFTFSGKAILDIIISKLQSAGCNQIIINTHHLNQEIEAFIASKEYGIPVNTIFEPVILGTGGAIKNTSEHWKSAPFMVINSDIITDIDLGEVYSFHLRNKDLATLVLHDFPELNSVSVDEDGYIKGFHLPETAKSSDKAMTLTFTGIQVLSPEMLGYLSDETPSSVIDAYRSLISDGGKIRAFSSGNFSWADIGTPERYRKASVENMSEWVFRSVRGNRDFGRISTIKLKGDGSERKWYRLLAEEKGPDGIGSEKSRQGSEGHTNTLIMADHGIRTEDTVSEIDSFVNIGKHLYSQGIPVPEIFLFDTFSGLVFMEDLGDESLQDIVQNTVGLEMTIQKYRSVIDLLIKMSIKGADGFNSSWTYQTPDYSQGMIIEKECRYFVEAFLEGYLGVRNNFESLKGEFIFLADKALEFSIQGFMHRDFQSRNIMLKREGFYLIDFQGGRTGPIQYDLASLLIDPYVDLPYAVRERLLEYCISRLSSYVEVSPDKFRECFRYCSITRNLQILGAFGYLSRVKGKKWFEEYIPAGVRTLKQSLDEKTGEDFQRLREVVDNL